MVPAGLVALSLALLTPDVLVEARCEVRGGHAPVVAGRPAEAQVGSVLEPDAAVLVRERSRETRLHYHPRITLRHPNPSGRLRPLVLHTLGASHDAHVGRSADWHADLDASIGDLDYLALIQLLPGQTALPTVTRYVSAGSGLGGGLQASRRWRLELRVSGGHSRPLESDDGSSPMPGALVFPRRTWGSFDPLSTTFVTRRDTLIVRSGVGVQAFSTDLAVLLWQPQATWRRSLTRNTELVTGAGVSLARSLQTPAGGESLFEVSPIGELGLRSLLHRERGLAVVGDVGARVTWDLDPVLAVGVPRGTATAHLNVMVGRSFVISPEAAFTTSLTAEPLVGTPDETLIMGSLPLRYRASDSLTLEIGAVLADRRPHLGTAVPEGRAPQREFWGTLSLVVSAASFDLPRPLLPARGPL